MNLEAKQNEIKMAYDDPNSLSKIAIELAGYMITLSYNISNAELEEAKARNEIRGKTALKQTIAEVEDLALAQTNNLYGQKKIEFDATRELINAIKTRISVLSWERQNV